MANNKVQLSNGQVIIDLTNDTVNAEHLFKGYVAHDKSGAIIVGTYEGGAVTTYSVVPKTETWTHNTYVTIGVDIGSDGSVSAYKSAGSGTANNMVVCYPQSNTYVAENEITAIPFPHEAGEHTIDVTIWWDNQSGAHQDHNNHTLTYTVTSEGGGESKNIQYSAVVGRVANNQNYMTTGCSITVNKTGNYKCSWMHYAYASSSQYYLTRLYVGNTAVGTTHASPAYSGTSGWVATENSISLTEGQTVAVYARARSGTQYYTVAGMLTIEEL